MKKGILFIVFVSIISEVVGQQIASKLYMIGDATDWNWALNLSVPMDPVDGESGAFCWSGHLKSGHLKFSSQNKAGVWDQDKFYYAPTSNSPVVLDTEIDIKYNQGGDCQFVVQEEGFYCVEVNTKALKMIVRKASSYPNNLYLIGDALPWKWLADKAVAMTSMSDEPGKFRWKGVLNAGGALKILSARALTRYAMYSAPSVNYSLEEENPHPIVYAASGDYKFIVPQTKEYIVEVDVIGGTIMITDAANVDFPKELWVVGSALPEGKAKLFQKNNGALGEYYYFGELLQGSFYLGNGSLSFFTPTTNGVDVLGTTSLKSIESEPSNKWSVAQDNNRYKIKVDLLSRTLTADIYTPRFEPLFIVGDATANGWIHETMPRMSQDQQNPDLFSLTLSLKSGELKFLGQRAWTPFVIQATQNAEPIVSALHFMIGGEDRKWIVDHQEPREYLVTLNMWEESIRFQDVSTSVDLCSINNSYKIVVDGRRICIIGMTDTSEAILNLYDITGRLVASDSFVDGRCLFTVDQSAVYVLKIMDAVLGETCHKVFLK